MKGLPEILQTRQDWLNAAAYADKHTELKSVLKTRLEGLLASKTCKVLKAGVSKTPEELTADDFEYIVDPASSLVRSGLTEAEIDAMIAAL